MAEFANDLADELSDLNSPNKTADTVAKLANNMHAMQRYDFMLAKLKDFFHSTIIHDNLIFSNS